MICFPTSIGKLQCAILLLIATLLSTSCDRNEVIDPAQEILINGTGSYSFTGYAPLSDKPVRVFYHIPSTASADTPILMVFHGNGRDALESRDAFISKSNQNGFIVVVPEFSSNDFPGGDGYNLGNVFEDGDHPTPATLQPESEWTFSLIQPIYEDFKERSGNTRVQFDCFGHSAGAQFLHRLLLFKPEIPIDRSVASASGWYTMPSPEISFPYGIGESPIESADLSYFFAADLTVMVGELDTDPNSFNLRHNEQSDAQGINRVERAQYFYNESEEIALNARLNFNWSYRAVPDTGHDFDVLSVTAADLLY